MTFFKFLLGVIFMGSLIAISGKAQTNRFNYNKYTNGKGDTLNYRQLFPDNNPSGKYPLIIFLHGSGERGNDNEAQLKWGVANFATDQMMSQHPAYVIAPQCPLNQTWSNFTKAKTGTAMMLQPLPSKPMELLIALVQQLKKTLPIDTNRIYITGLSMGGYGTFDIIERYPDLFAAAVPVCGGGDTSKAVSIAHIPMWIFHGAKDPAVNPQNSLDMLNALTNAGAHIGFTQYAEVGHFSWVGAYTDAMMIEWLFRQHK